ncbi:hypothetical protein SO802_028565 [Lithocarpus litseifolius]|uniref:Alpha/beta hydrolase fold-3 domain-containing protein n=1 Tax=Lithocarpus litseifolius TaxID=425828 RepID=A0AAW2BQX7_9ROSI
MLCGGGGGSRYLDFEEEDCDIEEDDEYIERVCSVNCDSLPICDDYPKDYCQRDKIELDENKVIYIQGEPITHIIDETFILKAQEVIDFFYFNHMSVQLVCSSIDEFSIDERIFNLLKFELEHIKHYDFIEVDELLNKNFPDKANVVVISVDYRLAPEHALPGAHEDSWAAMQWISAHSNGQGPKPWLNQYADFGRVFVAGESAGANITHYVAVQAGVKGLVAPNVVGSILLHPYFGGKEPDKMIDYLHPTSAGFKDPILYPEVDLNLSKMAGKKMLVCVAEKDWLKDTGVGYCATSRKSGWNASVGVFESEGEGHGFFLLNPSSDKVGPLMKVMVFFFV